MFSMSALRNHNYAPKALQTVFFKQTANQIILKWKRWYNLVLMQFPCCTSRYNNRHRDDVAYIPTEPVLQVSREVPSRGLQTGPTEGLQYGPPGKTHMVCQK